MKERIANRQDYLTAIVIMLIAFLKCLLLFSLTYEHRAVGIENMLYDKWAVIASVSLGLLIFRSTAIRLLFSFAIIGGCLNTIAMAFNDGYMPVSSLLHYDGHHHMPMWETVKVPFLCDWIGGIYSIGDIVLFIGILGFLVVSYIQRKRNNLLQLAGDK